MRLAFIALALSLLVFCAPAPAKEEGGDWQALTKEVNEIAAPGVPGTICVFGKDAFAVAASSEPIVAAARLGKGRLVVFAHTGYLDEPTMKIADTAALMKNAILWTSGGRPRVAVYENAALAKFLDARNIEGENWTGQLKSFNVIVIGQSQIAGDADSVREFVENGGGAIMADCPWGWLQLNPGKSLLKDHPGNKVTAPAGIVWADGYNESSNGRFTVKPPHAYLNASTALDALASGGKLPESEATFAGQSVTNAIRSVPEEDKLLLPRVRKLMKKEVVPTKSDPIKKEMYLDRISLAAAIEEARRLPPDEVKPHPAAREFPGIAEGKPVVRRIQAGSKTEGWLSTGLYAPPGKVISVKGSSGSIRIGCHSDTLWNLDEWRRAPDICTSAAISGGRIASAFGGLVYLEGASGEIEISGAIEAPYFIFGTTTARQWKDARNAPAPWAELATEKVIITVPSSLVRKLDGPEDLMKEWDKGLDAVVELVGIPKKRARPERYVADVQIGAGWMHSGYPIMTHLESAKAMVTKSEMQSDWGLWHELGHNHQDGAWTFDGAGEVTNNVICLYAIEQLTGKKAEQTHEALQTDLAAKAKRHHDAGADFGKWKSDPFLALTMYVQLQKAFGWDPFKKVFAEYRTASDPPENDNGKRDQWMVRFSKAVGRNLGPFFEWWGVPTSESARKSIADLPVWMP
ncbi:MAG: M60 family metallopeptidase [Planctomycetota bacterium]|nr:M60 family metallopeptidase [Planctomycetota bacterium]